jgi:hypothetical protein
MADRTQIKTEERRFFLWFNPFLPGPYPAVSALSAFFAVRIFEIVTSGANLE